MREARSKWVPLARSLAPSNCFSIKDCPSPLCILCPPTLCFWDTLIPSLFPFSPASHSLYFLPLLLLNLDCSALPYVHLLNSLPLPLARAWWHQILPLRHLRKVVPSYLTQTWAPEQCIGQMSFSFCLGESLLQSDFIGFLVHLNPVVAQVMLS